MRFALFYRLKERFYKDRTYFKVRRRLEINHTDLLELFFAGRSLKMRAYRGM
ncbi:MAG: hypothetical protein LBJ60_02050 [Tannerellaceae bacterium]|nr:hypothetical protein [Tannerellaceae bacterium]